MTANAFETPATLLRLCPAYAVTPLLDLPRLAECAGVARVMVKDESKRMLGSFKSLGGMYAGLRALAHAAGAAGVAALLAPDRSRARLPALICASDGNHGLAIAAAARLAPHLAPPARIIVVEPARCACVAAAIEAGRPVRVPGDLESSAGMLSAGLASAPALALLSRRHIRTLAIEGPALEAAAQALPAANGPPTTPSGAAGLAGLLAATPGSALATAFALTPQSRVLLIATEGPASAPV